MIELKRTVKKVLQSPLGWRLAAPVRRNPCLVLAYHRIGRPGDPFFHVDRDVFRDQMCWLRSHCLPIGPDDLAASTADPKPRPRVLVTFDDGYRDYYELAYPILRDFGIPAVNFLSTQYLDDGRLFWWDVVTLAVWNCRLERVSLPWLPNRVFDSSPKSRFALSKACRHRIGEAPDASRDAILGQFFVALQVDPGAFRVPRQVMTWDEVRATTDLTCYGNHTHSHVRAGSVNDDTLDRELKMCADRIETEVGSRPRLFAYPIGDPCETAKPVLRRNGIEIAFSMTEGYVDGQSDWLDVRRYPGPPSVENLAWLAAGWARAE